MSSINKKITETQERVAQLKRKKILQNNIKKKKQRKLDIQRQRIIGKIILKYFPSATLFRPQRTEAENNIAFALIEDIVRTLAEDEELFMQLFEKATQEIPVESQQDQEDEQELPW